MGGASFSGRAIMNFGLKAWAGRVLGAALAAATAAPALAHPHVWVAVRSEVVFDADGKVMGVRHAWTFDEMYSAFAVQGLGKDGKPSKQELDELAKVNTSQLTEYSYFTHARGSGKRLEFREIRDATITLDDKKNVTLHFLAVFKEPASAGKAFVVQVFDPDYFVAFDFEKINPVTMKGAPQGCTLRMVQPKPLSDDETRRLQSVAGTNESPGGDFGAKLAPRAFIACP